MNIIERNNVTIQGRGNLPLLFAHGYGCDKTIWRLVAPAFESDYEVILFDHVGAGKSDTSQYDRTKYANLLGYASDVVEIGESLDIQGGVFIGHSVSAMIGLLASILNPALFEQLILIGPNPCYVNEGDYCGGFSYEDLNAMLHLMESNYESWAKVMAPIIMGNADRPELAEELLENFCSNQPDIARHFAHVTFLSDNRQDLSKVEVPSLILQCTADTIAPEAVGQFMHRMLKRSELRVLTAVGHCPHLSAPEETIKAIAGYLERVYRPRSTPPASGFKFREGSKRT